MIIRDIKPNLNKGFDKKKAVVVTGPRQVGKTTLIEEMVKDKKVLFLNDDNPQTCM